MKGNTIQHHKEINRGSGTSEKFISPPEGELEEETLLFCLLQKRVLFCSSPVYIFFYSKPLAISCSFTLSCISINKRNHWLSRWVWSNYFATTHKTLHH
jgi:hypothetical protein